MALPPPPRAPRPPRAARHAPLPRLAPPLLPARARSAGMCVCGGVGVVCVCVYVREAGWAQVTSWSPRGSRAAVAAAAA